MVVYCGVATYCFRFGEGQHEMWKDFKIDETSVREAGKVPLA